TARNAVRRRTVNLRNPTDTDASPPKRGNQLHRTLARASRAARGCLRTALGCGCDRSSKAGLAAGHRCAQYVGRRRARVVGGRVLVEMDADRSGRTAAVEVEREPALALIGRGTAGVGVLAAAAPFGGLSGVLHGPVGRGENSRTVGGAAAPVAVLVLRAV